jgi:hypothetical protein
MEKKDIACLSNRKIKNKKTEKGLYIKISDSVLLIWYIIKQLGYKISSPSIRHTMEIEGHICTSVHPHPPGPAQCILGP